MLPELFALSLVVGLSYVQIVTTYSKPESRICTGECVPHHQCINNEIVHFGEGIINPRSGFHDTDNFRICDTTETCCASDPIAVKPRHGCGQTTLISDGKQAAYGEFPWMAAILHRPTFDTHLPDYIYMCGGSLIHPNTVLTAAHSVAGYNPNSLKIRLGEWDMQTVDEKYPHQDRSVAEIMTHSQYDADTNENDVALLFLNETIKLGGHIQTICLPPQDTKFDHSQCITSGWGKNEFGGRGILQDILKKVLLPIVPREICQKKLLDTQLLGQDFSLHESFLCAGGEADIDTCTGDGGSPLVCQIGGTNTRYYQSGIVSWGVGCGENQIPGIYVNVAAFKNWIDEIFTNRNLDKSFYTYE